MRCLCKALMCLFLFSFPVIAEEIPSKEASKEDLVTMNNNIDAMVKAIQNQGKAITAIAMAIERVNFYFDEISKKPEYKDLFSELEKSWLAKVDLINKQGAVIGQLNEAIKEKDKKIEELTKQLVTQKPNGDPGGAFTREN